MSFEFSKRFFKALAAVPLTVTALAASPTKSEYRCPIDCSLWDIPEISTFFSRPFPTAVYSRSSMKENDKDYLLTVDLPGMEKKDINIERSGNGVTISGERKEETDTKDKTKRSYAHFKQTYQLPDDADLDKVDAILKNGVLKLTVPKNGNKVVKQIEIK